jgi:nicotinate phosphoribosyltransferase
MGVSGDAPWLDTAYKLVEYDDRPVLKMSTGKGSWPGRKQVFRRRDDKGQLMKDLIAAREEEVTGAEPLLKKAMTNGKGAAPLSLEDCREAFREEFARLPDPVKAIRRPVNYPVEFTPRLVALRQETERKLLAAG